MSVDISDRSNILNINVGILGHVDAGKTSLVRSLSTSLSTAALDKNPQSQQRGITLDLGFSSFTLPMPAHLATDPNILQYEHIQFTLVDCPGHASLIRTIIGGAQIIDMILLVVDANKGIQTQTAECIVIGEITTDNMIIVLNKVDTIPENEREAKIERVSNRIRKVFAATKFAGVPIVATAASVGGEKTIGAAAQAQKAATLPPSEGIEDLLNLIKQKVVIPARNYNAPFYYAIDHCFSIKGHGTVLTGTVLSGSVHTNSIIEIPHLQITRKVKSLQMFRKPVKSARQGDRVGICVTNLDASLIERSIACAPATVPLLQSVLCLVKKVRFFRPACKSLSKFHISIGHETVIATAVFFGSKQLAKYVNAGGSKDASGSTSSPDLALESTDLTTHNNSTTINNNSSISNNNSNSNNTINNSSISNSNVKQSALNATYHKSFPSVEFEFYDPDGSTTVAVHTSKTDGSFKQQQQQQSSHQQHHGYEYQEEMLSAEGLTYNSEPLQWALLQFQHSVYCPIGSLIIGSRLDTDTSEHTGSGNNNSGGGGSKEKETGVPSAAQQCRLAFFGPVKASLGGVADLPRTGVYSWKCKECEVFLLTDVKHINSTTIPSTTKSGYKNPSNSTTSVHKNAPNAPSKDTLVYEAVVWKLITGGGAITPFLGMQVETIDKKITGTIVSSYGADGKVRVKFSTGVQDLTVGSKLLFRYKKYLFDKSKKMDQTGLDELRREEAVSVDSEEGVSDDGVQVGGDSVGGSIDDGVYVSGSGSGSGVAGEGDGGAGEGGVDKVSRGEAGTTGEVGNEGKVTTDVDKDTTLDDVVTSSAAAVTPITALPPSPPLSSLSEDSKPTSTKNSICTPISATPATSDSILNSAAAIPGPVSIATTRTTFTPLSTLLSKMNVTSTSSTSKNHNIDSNAATTATTPTLVSTNSSRITPTDHFYPPGTSSETHLLREGTIESVKVEGTSEIVIVKSAFRMEENIRLYTDAPIVSNVLMVDGQRAVGSLVGPFGKMGKCKVKFDVGQAGSVGDMISIFTLK